MKEIFVDGMNCSRFSYGHPVISSKQFISFFAMHQNNFGSVDFYKSASILLFLVKWWSIQKNLVFSVNNNNSEKSSNLVRDFFLLNFSPSNVCSFMSSYSTKYFKSKRCTFSHYLSLVHARVVFFIFYRTIFVVFLCVFICPYQFHLHAILYPSIFFDINQTWKIIYIYLRIFSMDVVKDLRFFFCLCNIISSPLI